jgi:two-component system response regulator FixJ
LTQREREVLDRMVEGETSKTIALELGISERTVEKHRESLMHKLGVRSLAQLIRRVVEHQKKA